MAARRIAPAPDLQILSALALLATEEVEQSIMADMADMAGMEVSLAGMAEGECLVIEGYEIVLIGLQWGWVWWRWRGRRRRGVSIPVKKGHRMILMKLQGRWRRGGRRWRIRVPSAESSEASGAFRVLYWALTTLHGHRRLSRAQRSTHGRHSFQQPEALSNKHY